MPTLVSPDNVEGCEAVVRAIHGVGSWLITQPDPPGDGPTLHEFLLECNPEVTSGYAEQKLRMWRHAQCQFINSLDPERRLKFFGWCLRLMREGRT